MANQVISGLELWQWYRQAQAQARQAEVSLTEVDWLLQQVAGLERLALRLESFKDSPQLILPLSLAELRELWRRRLEERVPVQYLAGVTPWRHFSLQVSPAVLIPRPETELIVDIAVAAVQRRSQSNSFSSPWHWVDLGTGSGAIAIGLAAAFPNSWVHAVDYSLEALAVAQQNAKNLGFADRIQFYQGSWWQPLASFKGQIGGMVANPPYIPSHLLSDLQPEVARHEPHLALDGGWDGLDCIRHLVATAPEYLRPGGLWLIEMMAGQAESVTELLRSHGSYDSIEICCDLTGIERFVLAYRCE
ncbi:MAG: peptide chain release factor N(5)-glutamine methyltransferase [Actinomycetota bacterium]